MSAITDFTFNNPLIKNYFLGSDDYIPTPEFLYIHRHPMIKENFVSEVEVIINQTSEYLQAKNMKGGPVKRLVHLAQSLGEVLPIQDEKNAAKALGILRDIYRFCNDLTARG